jgi:hypothetical protein
MMKVWVNGTLISQGCPARIDVTIECIGEIIYTLPSLGHIHPSKDVPRGPNKSRAGNTIKIHEPKSKKAPLEDNVVVKPVRGHHKKKVRVPRETNRSEVNKPGNSGDEFFDLF